MLRMVNHMVDSYLELRRLLTRQMTALQRTLMDTNSHFDDWPLLLESRDALHRLEDTCEDQRSAIQEWIDVLDDWPQAEEPAAQRERELLRVRSRDVHEHMSGCWPMCAAWSRRASRRCRCTSRPWATAPTPSCAR